MDAIEDVQALDAKVQHALQKKDVSSLVPLVLQYNAIANNLDVKEPANESLFNEIKNKIAEIYTEISNQMHLPNAKLLAALYHIQGKNFDRGYKIVKLLSKQSLKKGQDKFLDKDLILIVELLSLKDPQQALKEARLLKRVPDPQIKEIILDTAELIKMWKKGATSANI